MIAQARFGLRVQRFEVIAVAVAALVVGLSALVVRWRLDSVGVPGSCWDQWFFGNGPQSDTACSEIARTFLGINEDEGGKVMAAMAILPLFAGLFLGVPLVARELESGTAPTVWALAPSRKRWLGGRLLPVLVVAVLALAFLAVASELLWVGREPWQAHPNFGDVGLHGPGVLARGLAMLGLGLLTGALLGRVLPAVIVGVLLCFVLFTGWGLAFAAWGSAAAQIRPMADNVESYEQTFPGGTSFSDGWQTGDGRVIYDYEEALALAPAGVDAETWLWSPDARALGIVRVMRGIPGSAYPQWALLETVGLGAIGLVSLGLSFLVVDRRRPIL